MSGWRRRSLEISIALIVLDLLIVLAWISSRLRFNPEAFSAAEVTPPIVMLGVLVALITYLSGQRRQESEEYLEGASDLLEKAYAELATERDDLGRPLNSRLNWLTAARLIKTAQRTARNISHSSHQEVWIARREYWRGRFYDLIMPPEDFPPDYFAEKPEHWHGYVGRVRPPLSEKSLVVLYRFVQWPKEMPDSIGEEEPFQDEEIQRMVHFGPKGLGKILEDVRAL